MGEITRVGVDLAKRVIQVHAVCAATLIVSGGTTTMMAGGEESKAA